MSVPLGRSRSLPKDYPPPGPLGATDPTLWRLDSSSDGGRHVWHYARPTPATAYEAVWGDDPINVREREQNNEEKHALGLPLPVVPGLQNVDGDMKKAAQKGYDFYKRLQSDDGHWSGQYGGPMFLLPGIVIAMYVTKQPIPEEWKIEISRYLFNTQRHGGHDDQGWGIHTESKSSVFGTGLNYVVLRLLGVDAEHPMMVKARGTLHQLGGAGGIPSWGKFWLSILNVYEWKGVNPTPAELWLLPTWLPFHPHRWWIHTRNVYIPMGYLSGKGFKAELNPLLLSLRQELYPTPYESINWPSLRNHIAAVDLYSPHSAVADFLFGVLNIYEGYAPGFIRRRAVKKAYELVKMEDENTSYQTIGPVSKAMNMLCVWLEEGPDSEAFKMHVEKVRDFMYMSKEGMMMCGTNGSQLWDLAFMTQALVDTGLGAEEENAESTKKALEWLDKGQIRENPKWYHEAFRHSTKGAWGFSTKEQGYTVSDCTAEGLKSVMMLQDLPGMPQLVSKERMCDSIDLILSLQNPSGGFASYELIRGPEFLELLNPAEVFAKIMIEVAYPECSTACVTALNLFRKKYPDYRPAEIERAINATFDFIKDEQRADGSWYGSWGVCFTYATMFAVESLSLAGETYENSESVKKACDFLLSKQMDDGGWGESFKSCESRVYVHNVTSQVVNTAWAVLTLLHAHYPDPEPIKRGCRLIMERQQFDGSWKVESIMGVFNHNVTIEYPNFVFSWTIWALGKAAKVYGPSSS
ncbi:lanosterol synthase [Pseudohyphozyma bogoriensis]|nr:lanosterol synthase [Pseudohyphozyma bogoriensis]